jgi:hypothetical protein
MNDQSFSVTPPPDLVEQWVAEVWHEGTPVRLSLNDMHIAGQAATWAANQELEACRQLLEINKCPSLWIDLMMSFRRPKPLSLKQQAAIELDDAVMRGDCITVSDVLPILRRVIEALPE